MTVTGKGYQARQWDLGEWRWPIAIGLWIMLAVLWILPMVVMFIASLHTIWTGSELINPEAVSDQLHSVVD